ncbi:hypothetical protein LPJ81_000614 [Coemansia sp. IMI 209127]|nr:hypothetical protein LPJ81_000614 [Coemansia sp. IMI 209127]
MHVGNLPPEVLATILKLICEERHYRINKWISRMGILAVCRQWRLLALPMVYKKVSIDNIDKVRTNMDLMTDTMAHYPRALNIWVSCDDGNSVRRLQDVVEKLHAKKSMLHRVFNLHLHVDFTALPTDGDSDDDNDDSEVSLVETEKLQEVACSLKTLFPKISTLHCHINIAEAAGLVFETALLKQYVSQLVKVEVNSLALTPEMCFTDTISDLSVWWYPDSGSIPSINTNRMTKLELAGIDEAFDWSTFAPKDSTESNVLYFPVLQHIFVDVWYMPEDADNDDEESEGTLVVPRNAFSNVLNAPRLRVLKLRLCPFTCSFIASIAAPKVFKILEIFTLSDLRFEFFGFRLSEAAKKLFTKYYDEHSTHGMIDDMKFVNELQSTKELEYHSLSRNRMMVRWLSQSYAILP